MSRISLRILLGIEIEDDTKKTSLSDTIPLAILDAVFGAFKPQDGFHSHDVSFRTALHQDASRNRSAANAALIATKTFGDADLTIQFYSDCMTLESGMKPITLGATRLWTEMSSIILHDWTQTKSDLLALNEDWDVWTRWYDALLEGREPESEAMAIARVSLPEALWAQGPKAVNAEIKRLEEEQYIKNSNFPSAATQSFPQTPREWDIFISYSAHDEAEAREICEIIESTGLTTFARFKDVAMDDNFIAEIERGVARSGRLVALFSPNYAVSKRCQSELSAARRVNPQRETEKSIVLILHPTQLETGDSVYNSLFGLTGDARRDRVIEAISDLKQSQLFDLRQQPNIPVQHLAAIEPLVKNNLLTLPKATAQSDQKGQSPAASLKALKRQLTNLSAALKEETNIDRRIIAYLDRLEGVIPLKRPTQFILFELGHEITLLQGYANQVNAEWPEFLAQSYHTATLAYERTIRQFPKWREFQANAAKDGLFSLGQVDQVPNAARAVNEALRAEEISAHVDPALTAAVQSLADRLNSLDMAKEELAADLLESLSNIFKAVAAPAIEGTVNYAKWATPGFVKAAKKQASKDGEAVFKWARKIILAGVGSGVAYGGTLLANWLGLTFPEYFSWLPPVAAFLIGMTIPAKKPD